MTQPRRDGPDARGPWETDGQPGTIRVAYGQHRSPKRARPSESTSSVAISAAKASGSHAPALSTEGANRYRIVTWAVAASATNGDGVLPGWSAIAKASKPSSSAFLASASHASRPVGCPCKANEIFTNQDSHRFNSDRHGPPDSLRSSSTPATRPRPSATHSLRTESPTFAPHGDKPTINDAFAPPRSVAARSDAPHDGAPTVRRETDTKGLFPLDAGIAPGELFDQRLGQPLELHARSFSMTAILSS